MGSRRDLRIDQAIVPSHERDDKFHRFGIGMNEAERRIEIPSEEAIVGRIVIARTHLGRLVGKATLAICLRRRLGTCGKRSEERGGGA